MKALLCFIFVGLLVATAKSSDELCDLTDNMKVQAVQCITNHVSAQMKSKWEALKQTFGSQDDLLATNKLCELRKGAAESGAKTAIFTKAEEDEIKSAFEACKAQAQPKTN
ncbi:hypothetical protein HPB49_010426 [Dermacentor silvarum]|uniref:Uncharacterized protein n=1 Tax=Dermacentor silvarum TaxID=543639 RepID=A0ACB8DZH9_DERSI|nr:uncharacterized protein LOC119436246 [Dermacentor silvarum]KAH7979676.1 hypothetical protein HPB49_010426 [Dermacentor silvarum]